MRRQRVLMHGAAGACGIWPQSPADSPPRASAAAPGSVVFHECWRSVILDGALLGTPSRPIENL
jgi:hypothetical protein